MKKAETFFRGDANDRKKTRNIFRAPANVPMMFVYTWAIGLLAGNEGIVRISDRTLQRESVQDVLRVFRELFSQEENAAVKERTNLISYARSDAVTEQILAGCRGRVPCVSPCVSSLPVLHIDMPSVFW